MEYSKTIPCLLALMAVLAGCGKSSVNATVAQAVVDSPNCLTGQDHLWSELYRQVEESGALPAATEIESEVRSLARTSDQADSLVAAYSAIAHETRFLSREAALVRLAQMEIGDRTTEEKSASQNEIEAKLANALASSVTALGACPTKPSPPGTPPAPGSADSIPLFEAWRTTVPASLYGAYKTLSVGYQSCNAVALPALSLSIAAISGVTVTGNHVSGTGLTREVTDAAAVYRTNPFYSGRRSPASGCFTAPDSPLIYDYGGKPYTTTAGSTIDLTRNAGSGTDALGIDCSGFVTTSVLAGGLRLKQNVSSKAAQSGGVSASMFADPSGNGLTCFNRLASTKTEDLRSGDIIANTGHVVLVDKVNADPFGIAGAKTAADCDKVTASNFKFTIIQSSASKGGIGMNRYLASDFLAGYSAMNSGLVAYAKSFCRVRLGLDPVTTLANTSKAVVIRNQGGAACTDTRIALTGESCLQGCGSVMASSE
jgi:hypothetical protein